MKDKCASERSIAGKYGKILISQLRSELTEAAVYARLAELDKEDGKNRKILAGISADEAAHARIISN